MTVDVKLLPLKSFFSEGKDPNPNSYRFDRFEQEWAEMVAASGPSTSSMEPCAHMESGEQAGAMCAASSSPALEGRSADFEDSPSASSPRRAAVAMPAGEALQQPEPTLSETVDARRAEAQCGDGSASPRDSSASTTAPESPRESPQLLPSKPRWADLVGEEEDVDESLLGASLEDEDNSRADRPEQAGAEEASSWQQPEATPGAASSSSTWAQVAASSARAQHRRDAQPAPAAKDAWQAKGQAPAAKGTWQAKDSWQVKGKETWQAKEAWQVKGQKSEAKDAWQAKETWQVKGQKSEAWDTWQEKDTWQDKDTWQAKGKGQAKWDKGSWQSSWQSSSSWQKGYSEAAQWGGGKLQCQFTIGIEEEANFRVVRRILGTAGSNMKKVATETGAKLRLRGQGSKFLEGPEQQEADEPLMLCISAGDSWGYQEAIKQVTELLTRIYSEHHKFCARNGDPAPSLEVQLHEGPREGALPGETGLQLGEGPFPDELAGPDSPGGIALTSDRRDIFPEGAGSVA
eukprot:CAMPEP_0195058962 /NCGR_PEP_ID=MMETSP0448-20130528/6568_1 /TAXON_ID=66468 /ORGANISM="Heterocapsa triquestra, Strain CCMP 448" /LENGTH=516 /DNA_ID=CAMNT_0040089149 /DNA_START=122 /DNA_END=1669 /DNA_ORIENTATION=-